MLTDFDNLVKIVDVLGGLNVPLSEAEAEYYNQSLGEDEQIVTGKDGYAHLNGKQVLMHCRNRTIGNGDWSRTERQRSVLGAFMARAKEEKDVASLSSLMYKLMDYVETNLNPWDMISIGTGLIFGSSATVPQTGTIPCRGGWSYAYEGKMAVIHIDLEANKQWLHEFIYGAR